jgi:hypothetical protein
MQWLQRVEQDMHARSGQQLQLADVDDPRALLDRGAQDRAEPGGVADINRPGDRDRVGIAAGRERDVVQRGVHPDQPVQDRGRLDRGVVAAQHRKRVRGDQLGEVMFVDQHRRGIGSDRAQRRPVANDRRTPVPGAAGLLDQRTMPGTQRRGLPAGVRVAAGRVDQHHPVGVQHVAAVHLHLRCLVRALLPVRRCCVGAFF